MANAVYSNARARALEVYLLGRDRIDRMIDCVQADDALKVLEEINFGEGASVSTALDFELLINAEKKKLFDFIRVDCPSEALKDYFLLKSDFHNAEAYVRGKHLKIDVEDMCDIDGSIDKKDLKEKIMVDDYSSFPTGLAKALAYADEEFVAGRANGMSINAVFEKAYFEEIYLRAQKNAYLKEIYKVKADVANVSIALRLRNYNEAKELFVFGGSFSDIELKSICEEQLEAVKEKFKFCKIANMIAVAVDCVAKGQPLSDFENMAESFAVQRLLKEKYAIEGILPFIQYCFYKLTDLTNVRIVMVGLINGLDKAEIKRRLRTYYER